MRAALARAISAREPPLPPARNMPSDTFWSALCAQSRHNIFFSIVDLCFLVGAVVVAVEDGILDVIVLGALAVAAFIVV